jgi:diguanylate cyclase (GGDEF)-like protein/PAS domain S-box-containing protein
VQGTRAEAQRLEALRRYAILDSEAEASFDRLCTLASRLLEAPVAFISFIDEKRQWFKSIVGFPVRELPRHESFCQYTIRGTTPFIVPDTLEDARFSDLPVVSGPPGVRFYAGMPILTRDAHALGALAVVDVVPRTLESERIATLVDLAAIVMDQLEARATVLAERLLDKITRTSPDVIYLFDLERQRIVYRSCEGVHVPGYDGAEPHPAIHPDDLPRVRAHLAEFADAADGTRQQSYRIADERGGYRWLLANETVFERHPSGRPSLLLGVASDITELKLAQAELARLAVTDEMTGLPNLRALHERLSLLIAEAARGRQFALVMLDVDHFKMINDTHGHTVGDAALKQIARTLREHIRATDFVARYGGEEFCILFTDVDQHKAFVLADKLRAAIASITLPFPVTASLGVCASSSFGGLSTTAVVLSHAADDALYRAKRAGRNRVDVAVEPSATTGLRPPPSLSARDRTG